MWVGLVVAATVTDGTHAIAGWLSVGSVAAADASTLAGTEAAVEGATLEEGTGELLGATEGLAPVHPARMRPKVRTTAPSV